MDPELRDNFFTLNRNMINLRGLIQESIANNVPNRVKIQGDGNNEFYIIQEIEGLGKFNAILEMMHRADSESGFCFKRTNVSEFCYVNRLEVI